VLEASTDGISAWSTTPEAASLNDQPADALSARARCSANRNKRSASRRRGGAA
jgi:hypothetical protein